MEKPVNMSVKDFIVRRMAVKLRISEEVLQKVVAHQFNSLNGAMQVHERIEISGFGTMMFSTRKAHRKMGRLMTKLRYLLNRAQDEQASEKLKKAATYYSAVVAKQIEHLKPRVNVELFPDLRGLEEQYFAFQGAKEQNSTGEQGEDGDMRGMYVSFGGEEGKAELQDPAS